MIISSQQVFDKFYLGDNPSEFIEYISHAAQRELVNKVMDKLEDHGLYVVRLREPRLIEDVPEYLNAQCAYRQDLECREVVQCENCRMVYPWCQRFRDEFGGNGFCPYGKEI